MYQLGPKLKKNDPNYKGPLGELVYPEIEEKFGEALGPKLTGMMIDQPFEDIVA